MSRDQVEIVRSAFEAVAERGVEAMLEHVADDFEMQTPAELAAEPDVYRGHDGIRRWFSSFYEAVDSIRFEPLRLERRGDRVVMDMRMTTRGRSTGLEGSQETTAVCDLRDEEITRMSFYPSWADAVADLGD